jgi:hypothetical protein
MLEKEVISVDTRAQWQKDAYEKAVKELQKREMQKTR